MMVLLVIPATSGAQTIDSQSAEQAKLDPVVASVAIPVTDAPPAEGFIRIPVNTAVNFQIVDALSSKTSKIDDMFAIRIIDPVMVDGKVVLPTGTVGEGQVVHAAKARGLGKAGEMILAARFLQCGDAQLALRGFRFGYQGIDRSTQALAASIAFLPVGFFITGGELTVPAGASASARFSRAVDVRVSPTAQCTGPAPIMIPASMPSASSTPTFVPASVSKEEGKSK